MNEIYKCSECGAVFEALEGCECEEYELICCGKPLEKLEEKSQDEGKEKHVPVIEKTDKGVKVRIGSVPHPMEDEHYIELIEVLADGRVLASYHPSPGERPEAEFHLSSTEGITARILCNVHGLWKS